MIDNKLLDYAIGYSEVGGFNLDYNLIKELLIKKKAKDEEDVSVILEDYIYKKGV